MKNNYDGSKWMESKGTTIQEPYTMIMGAISIEAFNEQKKTHECLSRGVATYSKFWRCWVYLDVKFSEIIPKGTKIVKCYGVNHL